MSVLATQNEGYGFWGTMHLEGEDIAERAWPLTSVAIAKATGEDADSIRAFLDSRRGRHFADDVHNGLFLGQPLEEAIDTAVDRWMNWRLSRATKRQLDVPLQFDAPYLTTMVIVCGIEAEVI